MKIIESLSSLGDIPVVESDYIQRPTLFIPSGSLGPFLKKHSIKPPLK